MLHKCLSADHILIGPSLACKVIGYGIAENVLEKEIFARDKGVKVVLFLFSLMQTRKVQAC